MKKIIIHISLLLILSIAGLIICNLNFYFYGERYLSYNFKQLPYNLQPEIIQDYINSGATIDLLEFISEENEVISTNIPLHYDVDSYMYNKENNILIFNAFDYKLNKESYILTKDSSKIKVRKISPDEILQLNNLSIKDNLYANVGLYYALSLPLLISAGILLLLLIISVILSFLPNYNKPENKFFTLAIYTAIIVNILTFAIHEYRSNNYGIYNGLFPRINSINISVTPLRKFERFEKYLVSFIDRDKKDIISEGDYITSCSINRIKSIISYCRFKHSVLFSYAAFDDKIHYAKIEQVNGKNIISEITKNQWNRFIKNNHLQVYSNFIEKHPEFLVKSLILCDSFFYILIVVFPIYFIRRMFYYVS